MPETIFLSHTTADDLFVHDLRLKLESRGYTVLEDATAFRPGDNLPESVRKAIDITNHVIGVVSAEAVKSGWVKRELRYAQKIARERNGFRVIPMRLSGVSPAELRAMFELAEPEPGADLENWPAELIAIDVGGGAGAMDKLIARIVDAIEGRSDSAPVAEGSHRVTDLADLVLRLHNPRFEIVEDESGVKKRRPTAEARLAFYPPGAAEPQLESQKFTLVAPLGKIETGDLSYYLERYHITPFGVFAERAHNIEERLPEWGEDLWNALQPHREEHTNVFKAWKRMASTAQRRFTIEVPPAEKPLRNATAEQTKALAHTLGASTELLSLPWELVHDGIGYLFHDGIGVRVRRSLPGGDEPADLPAEMRKPPLRVLIVCARPEGDGVDYIDHRGSVRPLTEALNALGDLASYDILVPPTFPALKLKLREALERGKPYHIVHFDGHGVYDQVHGLGSLVFEHPDAVAEGKLVERAHDVITADRLGAELRNAGVGLFFLEACQSAKSEEKPEGSVAGKLLQSGIASVAAMSHSVLVETAKQFTEAFYPALVRGERVGAAMLVGQRHLYDQRHRGWAWAPRDDGSGKVDRRPLELQDWFVPVLYQDGNDPVLLTETPPAGRVQEEIQKGRALDLGDLPAPPEHAFVGRSRELLAAERLLIEQGKRYVVLRGEGGEGKTTLATELARWLVSTRRIDRAAFASVENHPDARALLWTWGGQLVPNFASRAGESLESAERLVVHTLAERDTVLVLDNVESILAPPAGSEAAAARVFDQATLNDILGLCHRLLEQAANTRLIFTSRESLPDGRGFDEDRHRLEISRLSVREGMELVARVLAQTSDVSAEALQAEHDEEIKALVEIVNAHARSLVLLTPELARRGLSATTQQLAEIMADLENRYPGERERSLFASVELSLRRLPVEVRKKILPLGVFQGGGNVRSIAIVAGLNIKQDEEIALAAMLRDVGLVEILPPERMPYLRFDPALAPALWRDLVAGDDDEKTAEGMARSRWAEAYQQLAGFLHDQRPQNAHLVAHLTLLEVSNLLHALRLYNDLLEQNVPVLPVLAIVATAESVIAFATCLERLLQYRERRDALSETTAIRERAQKTHEKLRDGAWTRSAYLAARQHIERLLDRGRFREAAMAAGLLVEKAEAAGDDSYEGIDYDRAMAQWTRGRAVRNAGEPELALEPILKARACFESLAETLSDATSREAAAKNASACLTEEADCLRQLGQLDAAAVKYKEAIERDMERGDLRDVAVGKGQLGTVRLRQQRYHDAVNAFEEARATFESLGEDRYVSVSWSQIGRTHQAAGNFEEAEKAYQRALAIEVQTSDKSGEANTRTQLGTLCRVLEGRLEEAVQFARQAAEIYASTAIGDRPAEGAARSNAAHALIGLKRFGEARAELIRAFECLHGLGLNAESWKTWMILSNLENAVGNTAAAANAKRQAMAEYEKARRQGWQITAGAGFELCQTAALIAVAKNAATADEIPEELREQLPQIESGFRQRLESYAADPEAPAYLRSLAPKLLAIVDGSRDHSLADDYALDFDDAVELKLLLEQIGG